MITHETFYGVSCDRCGCDHEISGEYTYWGDSGEMVDDALRHGWVELHGKHYCPACYVLKDGTMRTDMDEACEEGEDDRDMDNDENVYVPRPSWPLCVKKVQRFLKAIDASIWSPKEQDGYVLVKISLGHNGVLTDLTRQMVERICEKTAHSITIVEEKGSGGWTYNYAHILIKLTEFKCGDRVRVTEHQSHKDAYDKQGVVMALSSRGERLVGIQFRDETDLRWMAIDNLEAVEECGCKSLNT